jgi:hypothetical protein
LTIWSLLAAAVVLQELVQMALQVVVVLVAF